jgi:hypothetical protein
MKLGGNILRRIRDTLDRKSEPEGVRTISDIYWKTLLASAFIALVCVFFYGTWDLLGVLNALAESADTSAPPPPALSRTTLDGVLQAFETRRSQFTNFKSSPPPAIPDPSR